MQDVNKEAQTLSAEQKQMLGADDVGQVLNRLSDPNYVDPNQKVRGTGSNSMDKDAFFKLMLTQLKYQDPTNPMKNHEMAAQLAQFSGLEQMSNMNSTLSEIKNAGKKYPQKINTNLSYGFLKNRILELLFKEAPLEQVLDELESLFLKNTIPIRKNRNNERNVGKYRNRIRPFVLKNQKDAI